MSTAAGAVVAEFAARIVLDPVDYLKPRLVQDEILHHHIEPGSGGHDEWGFRNPAVPESVDIVAIGDSQTYGVGTTSGDAWPAALSRRIDRSVYSLALGGYGPVQYLYLLEHRALALDPSLVIVGFYYGNDIRDAYNAAAYLDSWESLRDSAFVAVRDSLRRAHNEHRGDEPEAAVAHHRGTMTERVV
ncbi:MAG TPA: SGNH/GDSL hydrolase family protein, partial [Chromatiales bacterium]|nr:SGNH/GDSL hydrolase family protein [Chromatiales bacterium]